MKYDNPLAQPIFDEFHTTSWNTQEYFVNVQLYHQEGIPFDLKPGAVIRMTIEEDLLDWGRRIQLLIEDPHDILQRGDSGTAKIGPSELTNFSLTGNGEDFLLIDVRPCHTPEGKDDLDFESRPDQWILHERFAITEVTPTAPMQTMGKSLLIQGVSAVKHFMETTQIQWSTAYTKCVRQATNGVFSFMLDNNDRKCPTGGAIKALLRDIGLSNNVSDQPIELSTPNGKVVTSGGIPDGASMEFYTSDSNSTIHDDLTFFLDRHVDSQNNDFAIWRYDRSNLSAGEPMHFSLTPFCFYVEQAGEALDQPGPWQFEHFYLTDEGPSEDAAGSNPFSPFNQLNAIKTGRDYSFAYHNQIQKYQHVPRSQRENQYYKTQATSASAPSKDNQIEGSQATPSDAKSYLDENCIPFSVGGRTTANTTTEQESGRTASMHQATSSEQAVREALNGRNALAKQSIFLNDYISFESKGLTLRQPGRWIAIDRLHKDNENEYDHKLLGQWLVTKVVHQFQREIYTNQISAVKYFSFKALPETQPTSDPFESIQLN